MGNNSPTPALTFLIVRPLICLYQSPTLNIHSNEMLVQVNWLTFRTLFRHRNTVPRMFKQSWHKGISLIITDCQCCWRSCCNIDQENWKRCILFEHTKHCAVSSEVTTTFSVICIAFWYSVNHLTDSLSWKTVQRAVSKILRFSFLILVLVLVLTFFINCCYSIFRRRVIGLNIRWQSSWAKTFSLFLMAATSFTVFWVV